MRSFRRHWRWPKGGSLLGVKVSFFITTTVGTGGNCQFRNVLGKHNPSKTARLLNPGKLNAWRYITDNTAFGCGVALDRQCSFSHPTAIYMMVMGSIHYSSYQRRSGTFYPLISKEGKDRTDQWIKHFSHVGAEPQGR